MNPDTFSGRRVLITGGLGFIGSNLANRLVRLGARVMLVDSLIPEYGGNFFNIAGLEDQVQVNISDVRDEYSMRYLVQRQDLLFNLAGQQSHMDAMRDPYSDLDINCRQLARVYDAMLSATLLLLPSARGQVDHAYHQYVVRSKRRDDLRAFLEAHAVRTAIHYP